MRRQAGHDDYVLAIEDLRDGPVHVRAAARDLEPWLKSFRTGACLQSAFGLCGRCGHIHADRDSTASVPQLHPVSDRVG